MLLVLLPRYAWIKKLKFILALLRAIQYLVQWTSVLVGPNLIPSIPYCPARECQ